MKLQSSSLLASIALLAAYTQTLPGVTVDDGWNLSIPAGAPGVYMLVSPLAGSFA